MPRRSVVEGAVVEGAVVEGAVVEGAVVEGAESQSAGTSSWSGPCTVVRCRVFGESQARVATFDTPADVSAARRWRSSLRHIDCVEVHQAGSALRCSLRGTNHRHPIRQVIPLRVGLGLVELGVPLFVNVEAA